MDSADASLAGDRLHARRHRQLRRTRAERRRDAAALDHVLTAAPAGVAHVHGAVPVRAAVYGEVEVSMTDWRETTLDRMRKLIKSADPKAVEETKWAKASKPGIPVWSHDGILCTGETYKNVVKLTFAKGASLKDPARLFNSSLDGNVRRAIDIHEGEEVDESAFKAIVRQAVARNRSGTSKP